MIINTSALHQENMSSSWKMYKFGISVLGMD